MSRVGSTFSKHRKDNYSLDIKGLYKSSIAQTPFAKKKDKQDSFMLKLRTQVAHNSSMQSSDKQIGMRQRRRLSLSKTFKMNNSVGVETHLAKQKLRRVHQLMTEHQYEDSLAILRQLISREENSSMQAKLCWLNATCLSRVGKMKQAEQFLTKYLSYEPDNYEAIVDRAKIRYNMGSKQISIRDLKHAIKLQPLQSKAHLELCNLYLDQGNKKQSFAVASSALQKGVDSTELLLNIVQLLLISPNISVSSQKKAVEVVQKLREQIGHDSKDSADLLYLEAILLESKQKWSEACIYYEECLKYNNSKFSVTRSLERLILIKIQQRDYYSAYHTVNRYKILNIDTKYINPYIIFLEGVILVMKKKFTDGCKLFDNFIEAIEAQGTAKSVSFQSQFLQANDQFIKKGKPINIKIPHKSKSVILPLLLKFNAYASYKLGKHQKSVHYYQKLTPWGLDECSSYNKLLAQGIIACQKHRNFQSAMEKFEQGSYVYPSKVEPSIYLAMTVIYRDLCLNQPEEANRIETESLTSVVIHAIEQMNEAHQSLNDSSSNLLYHRCILNLYLEDWENAQSDINLCIQKAEENEPKYFYLRGLTYAVVKDLRKAINEYSISLSLDPQYIQSLLERAKCHFLLGETQIGFSDLKQYMYKNPTDHKVHKWIGDLLYEGKSYKDALKAYEEIDQTIFEVQVMKCKCLMRVADLQKINDCLNKISKLEECNQSKIQVDILAVGLIKILMRPHDQKQAVSKIKKLNSFLEQNKTGYIFDLIDCMNLLGIATLQAAKYEQSYESFLLVLELFTTLAIKNKSELKSDFSEESLSLHLEDVYFNMTACLLGMKDYCAAAKIISEELIPVIKGEQLAKFLASIAQKLEKSENPLESYQLEGQLSKNQKIKFKQIQFKAKGIKIKYLPTFSLFHSSADDLYSRSVARIIVKDLKPSYIDNMPEGPWIKRNQHGVIFTDQMIEDDGSSGFLSSMKAKQSQQVSYQNSQRGEEGSDKNRIEDFKKKMQLDSELEKRLNSIIQKTQRET